VGDVVNINAPKNGDTAFMICPCLPDGTPFMVVAIAGSAPIICSIVCPECEQEIPAVNGIIGET